VFDQFTHLVAQASGWAYVVVLLFAVVDALLSLVPSETAVITAGVVAGSGHLSLPLVIVVAAVGAFAGDNAAYAIGARWGQRVTDRYFRSDKASRRLDSAKRQLDRRGGELIAVGRFVPGGRTLVTLTAGLSHFPWPRFARYDAIAAVLWASYGALLGYFGGQAFEHQPWKGLLLALGIAFAITLGTEAVRHMIRRRSSLEARSDTRE
jgi:membrane protein DedA with SNARE-associated domain